MRENERPTVFPLRICRLGFPERVLGRLMVRHVQHGWMVGEMVEVAGVATLIACGIDVSPQRNPVAFMAREDDVKARSQVAEWTTLTETHSPADRVRAGRQ